MSTQRVYPIVRRDLKEGANLSFKGGLNKQICKYFHVRVISLGFS